MENPGLVFRKTIRMLDRGSRLTDEELVAEVKKALKAHDAAAKKQSKSGKPTGYDREETGGEERAEEPAAEE